MLEVTSNRGATRIFFRDGDPVHADGPQAVSPQESLYDLFVHGGDTFTLSDDAELPQGTDTKKIDLEAIALEGRRRAEEWRRLAQLYPSEEIALRVIEDPKAGSGITLSPEEFKIVMRIGKGQTIAELRSDLKKSPAELYPALHRLESAGLLERLPARETPAPKKDEATATPLAAPADVPAVGSLTSADGKMIPLVDDIYLIGRDRKSDIAVDDTTVSTVHARIARTKQGFMIEDVQSRNGTFVNGEKVDTPRLLVDGDNLRFGKIVFTFNLAFQAAPQLTTHRG